MLQSDTRHCWCCGRKAYVQEGPKLSCIRCDVSWFEKGSLPEFTMTTYDEFFQVEFIDHAIEDYPSPA